MFHFPLLLYAEWHHDIQKESRPFDTNLVPHRRSASTQRRWQGAKAVCDRPTWSLCQSCRETGLINSWISVFSSGGGEGCSACSCMTSASGKPSLAAEYIHAAWGHRGGWMRGIRNRLIYAWKCYLLLCFFFFLFPLSHFSVVYANCFQYSGVNIYTKASSVIISYAICG